MGIFRVAIPAVAVWLVWFPLGARPHAIGMARVTVMAVTGPTVQDWDRTVTDMVRRGQLRSREVVDDTLMAGRTHERFDEYYRGVRVFGGNTVRQMAGSQAVSIFSQLHPDVSLDPTPRLSPDDVTATVSRLANGEKPAGDPELVILPLDFNEYALAYRVRVTTPTDRLVYFIDANTGQVRWQYSDVQRQSAIGIGIGVFGDREKVSANAFGGMFVTEDLLRPPDIATFDMRGNVDRTMGFLDGVIALGAADLASSTNNTWTDGPDVDAHVYAGFTYDYYFKRFGRHGLDNRDIPLTVLTHPVRRSDLRHLLERHHRSVLSECLLRR